MNLSLWHRLTLVGLLISSSVTLGLGTARVSVALPPPEDIPEEVLRTEIIIEGRSPEDGELLTAEEYAEEQAATAATLDQPGEIVSPEIQQLILLLRIRKLVRPVLPFIP
ncbi:MAG: hypothetical protein AAFX78_12445 [Cyanobacteria bacterium J06638_20]